jgi:hypothetical protein
VRGYYLVIVSDCVVPDSGPDFDIVTRQAADRLGAIVVSTEEITRVWNTLPATEEPGSR